MRLNKDGYKHAKNLINRGKYVVDSDWSEDKPSAEEKNRFLEEHGWEEYCKWFLGIDPDAKPQSKERYKFPYGDFQKVHRKGLIAAKQRAAQNDYHDIEKAGDELIEMIDECEKEKV